jgi:molybdopterin-guanine dinucleotide biosynthesis protein A
MGWDKTQLVVGGTTLGVRTADMMLRVVSSAVEVGPGLSGLPSLREEPAGEGPLAAIAAGWDSLRDGGYTGALVVAGDLPFLTEALLRLLVEWATSRSVVPTVDGRDQPLCARWSRHDLDEASELLARGERSLRHLSERADVDYLDESQWSHVATGRDFADLDTPDDLRRLGISAPVALAGEGGDASGDLSAP